MKTTPAKSVILAIAATLLAIGIYHGTGNAVKAAFPDDFVSAFVSQVIFAALALIAVLILKETQLFRSDRALLKKGWKSAFLFFFFVLLYGFMGLANFLEASITPLQWVLFIGQMILVGFAEEVLFRGLIQRAFHRLFGEDSLGHVYLAIFCTGVLFGLAHLVNLDRTGGSLATLLQAGVNCFSGMYFCAVFFRTGKNIKYLIFLHALYDYVGMIANGRVNGESLAAALDPSAGAFALESVGVGILFWGMIWLLPTLFILRPGKVRPLLTECVKRDGSL